MIPQDGTEATTGQPATMRVPAETLNNRRLGNSELQVGPIAYGCWRFAEGDSLEARSKIEAAVDAGWNLIDTADIYGFDGQEGFGRAESLLGEVLTEAPALRQQMVLATKGGIRPGVPYDSSPEYLRSACEASLQRLRVDVIDLYQIHRPDTLTHPEELASALMDLHDRQLVREFGLSNVTPTQLALVQSFLPRPLVCSQPEFSLWNSEAARDGTLDQCIEMGLTPLAWSPLGGGRVSSQSAQAQPTPAQQVDSTEQLLSELAKHYEVAPASIALAFVLGHPAAPIPILGTQRVERIHQAAEALTVKLSRQEWYSLYQAGTGEQLP